MLTIEEVKKLPMVFIVAKGRSGTSLLQTILDANPSVITANESPLIIHLKQKYSYVTNWTSQKLDEFIEDLYKDLKFTFIWEIDAVVLRKSIDKYNISDLDFSTLCKLVYLAISSPFPKEKIAVIVDKNPIYSVFIGELLDIFPDAKFIHLVRDYRDNVISSMEAFEGKDVAVWAQRWKKYNQFIENYKKKYPALFYTLRYEDLVTKQETLVQELCSFLNITFNSGMLDFYKTTRKAYADDGSKNEIMSGLVQNIHVNLLSPVNTKQIDKWKKKLTTSQIEVIDHIAGDYAKRYGYERSTNVKSVRFFLVEIKSYLIYSFNYYFSKIYYNLSFKVRDTFRKVSRMLYDKWGYSNRYNRIGVLYRKK